MSLLRLVNPRTFFKIQRHYKTLKYVIPDGFNRFDKESATSEYVEKYKTKSLLNLKAACVWLWCFTTIQWEGTVIPCCYLQDSYKFAFGNIRKQRFSEIWNGLHYRSARHSFRENSPREFTGMVPTLSVKLKKTQLSKRSNYIDTVCHHCAYYQLF